MQSLRLIARKINTQKFMQLYKDRMPSKCCQLCNVKSEGPTTFLAHYTSKDHCNRARNNGFKATEADIALWRSQILASM
ncbi:hypothetical protein OESDEN_05569 [Oesophagostomum dentatum]|uniref:U1-type domain-containing protein n=1 Tax=Oesophagostomum dentatum TaxID=61180 RepID=A0A0B1TF92_OESDE|nr:hypothetical protein OESDEN_05569 [Oesophagostomum dentatum]